VHAECLLTRLRQVGRGGFAVKEEERWARVVQAQTIDEMADRKLGEEKC